MHRCADKAALLINIHCLHQPSRPFTTPAESMRAAHRTGWRIVLRAAVLGLLVHSHISLAQSTSAATSNESPGITVPAGTPVHLRMLDTVSSNTHKRGDHFRLEVAEPVIVNGHVVIPNGAAAQGEVVHAAKAGLAGRSGELILASRSAQVGDRLIGLRSFSAGISEGRTDLSNGVTILIGIPGLLISGKNISLPAGTDIFAKVAIEYVLPSISHVPTEGSSDVQAK